MTNSAKKTTAKILYVEDDHLNQKVIKAILDMLGYEQVVFSDDANAALELLADPNFKPLFILTDIGLPGIDGIALVKKIRESHFASKNTPIIAITGNVNIETREKCFEAGMNGFLTKPVDAAQLRDAIDKALAA